MRDDLKFFKTQADWRKWLAKNHAKESELVVGFYKKSCGKPSIDWNQSVDEALCYGWIDGKRKNIDEDSYCIRFTPRKPGSNWSAKNIARIEELITLGLVEDAGKEAYEKRKASKSGIYAYENRKDAKLSPAQLKRFKANKKAWAYFSKQAPSYQVTCVWWVITAKKDETKEKRLAELIATSAEERWLKGFIAPKAKKK